MKTWTHKVVKQSRGGDGQWFDYPAAYTGTIEQCEQYAEAFLADQLAPTPLGNSLRGSQGHRITIQRRGSRAIEKVYRYDA
jgi:hypothetical protein